MAGGLLTGFALALAGAIALHEYGHALAAQILGLRWHLYLRCRFPFSVGVAAEANRAVAAAGPFASVAGAWLAAGLGYKTFAGVSLMVGLLSLIPFPMQDGWRMIRG